MKQLRKLAITLAGGLLLLVGLIFIVLPGPAILIIPLALVILAIEYPIAKSWLRKFQRSSRKAAQALDRKLQRR